ncbi:MAG: RNA polymerase subunit sigma-24 [Chloroflexi bacterium]|nr:MAG: RNA polymerase subunit sigma-24 [Chloroflexota bacterium]
MSVSAPTLDSHPHEKAWIAAAKVDPAAFAAIYDHYYGPVYTYVRYRLPDAAQADDVTAQIFERVLTSLARYEPEQGAFAIWLFAIARNAVTDQLRRLRRRRWLSFDRLQEWVCDAPQPEERVIRGEEQQVLLNALAKLSDRERDLLALKFAGQLTNRRIAGLTGLTESNVGVILFRALRRLRAELEAGDA